MANLNDLPLTADTTDDVDVSTVPTFGGGFTPPPQPGIYVGRLPAAEVIFNCFQTMETADQGQKLLAVFADESAIMLEQFNQPYRARISNKVRYVKVNDPDNPGEKKSIGVSDMAQLLKVVNSIPENKTNTAYGHALVAAHDRLFKFTHDLTASCDPKRDIYKDGAVIKGKKGCGARYATESYRDAKGKMVGLIPKDESGKFATRFECSCGASLSAWGQIKGFRVHQKYPPAVVAVPPTDEQE